MNIMLKFRFFYFSECMFEWSLHIPELICRGALSFVYLLMLCVYIGAYVMFQMLLRNVYTYTIRFHLYPMLYHHHDSRIGRNVAAASRTRFILHTTTCYPLSLVNLSEDNIYIVSHVCLQRRLACTVYSICLYKIKT